AQDSEETAFSLQQHLHLGVSTDEKRSSMMMIPQQHECAAVSF
ncbi:hypothetical protein scyTo_0024152, partial [Scyliorhinus torazame]|nr:hypothetical protein [Scyliorhinus torazame]